MSVSCFLTKDAIDLLRFDLGTTDITASAPTDSATTKWPAKIDMLKTVALFGHVSSDFSSLYNVIIALKIVKILVTVYWVES